MITVRHLRHHVRFYAAALAGIAAGLVARELGWPLPPLVGGDTFFLIYLALMVRFALTITLGGLRKRAGIEDEGIPIIVLLALATIVFSLSAIFLLLRGQPSPAELSIAIASIPLGWLTLHTILAFHYAHLFYAASDDDGAQEAGCLGFPHTTEPGAWDFLYFSFVVGMTAQVSDVTVQTSGMRRLVVLHGILSFFYNTVLLALAVNVAVSLVR
jgi:uncharacterized membrane protein